MLSMLSMLSLLSMLSMLSMLSLLSSVVVVVVIIIISCLFASFHMILKMVRYTYLYMFFQNYRTQRRTKKQSALSGKNKCEDKHL